MIKRIFKKECLTRLDLLCGVVFGFLCFIFFYHGDIAIIGKWSLTYLYEKPSHFYEVCKKLQEGALANYPPSIFLIFAIWLYPFKLLGLITTHHQLPAILTYWLKALTTIVYFSSGIIFYKITSFYFDSKEYRKYATFAWLLMPIALFSEFIFCQVDIFYVALTLCGFLMFLKERIGLAAFFFGLAVTFKYFPTFVFIPLLLLFEKRPAKLIVSSVIFCAPLAIMNLLYQHSPAYIEGVRGFEAIYRIFAVFFDIGGDRQVYVLLVAFATVCGVAYFYDATKDSQARIAAYFWLVSSIVPFLFIISHPQWSIFFTPAIILTSMINQHTDRFFLLDLVGMFFLVGSAAILWSPGVDASMFHAEILGIHYDNSYLMARVFSKLPNSRGVFISGFWTYLFLQIILKYPKFFNNEMSNLFKIDYGYIRKNMYIGLLIFILPALYTIYRINTMPPHIIVDTPQTTFGELLKNRVFEQTFVSKGDAIDKVRLLLATFARHNFGQVTIELIDSTGSKILKIDKEIKDLEDNRWYEISLNHLKVKKGASYKIRLTSPTGVPGNSITWWASKNRVYLEGNASVDNIKQNADFSFMVFFP